MLIKQCGTLLRELRDRVGPEDDLAGVAALAHSLGGSAGMFGFQCLTDTALRLERAIKTKSPDTLGLGAEFIVAIEVTVAEMRDAMPVLPVAPETDAKHRVGADA